MHLDYPAFCLLSLLHSKHNTNTLLLSVLHPDLFFILDCPIFFLYLQHTTQTSMPSVGFELVIVASEPPQLHTLDRVTTGICGIRSPDPPARSLIATPRLFC
jgi:hypothetical protein